MDQVIQDVDYGRGKRRLTTIVALDICGYSAMSERDEIATISLTDAVFDRCRQKAETLKGRVFKIIADACLIEFSSTRDAVHFAIEIRKELSARMDWPEHLGPVQISQGIHVGDVVDRPDGDILGHGVNVAVRLQENARPNEILASSNVVNLLPDNADIQTRSSGKMVLKNIEKPISTFAIEDRTNWIQRLSSHVKTARKGMTLAVLTMVGALFYWQYQSGSVNHVLRKNGLIAAQLSDKGASQRISKNAISADYVRGVLTNLKHSELPSGQAVYALLEKGDLNGAQLYLEQEVERYSPTEAEHKVLLHQIAALSYQTNPQRALAYYESILALDPKDKTALIWKFRTENLLGYPEKAQATYEVIKTRTDLDRYDRLLFTMDYAFSFSGLHEFDRAIEILRGIESDVTTFGDQRLFAHWQTELALAYSYSGELEQGEALSLSAVKTIQSLGADTNLSRAFSLLGLIAEKRAEKFPEQRELYLQTAYEHYAKEYEAANQINKITDKVEGLYSMAGIDLKRGKMDDAQEKYLKSLRLSRQAEHFLLEIYSLLGLAEASHAAGNNGLACNYVSETRSLFKRQTARDSKMSAAMMNRLKALDCD